MDGHTKGLAGDGAIHCPWCGETYELGCDDYKYCPECGQAIDWS